MASGLIAKDYIDLALNGNELGRSYSFTGTQAVSYVISNVKISFGFPIDVSMFHEFAIGATLKYFQGFGFASLNNLKGTFVTYDDGIDSDGQVVARYSKGGSGLGANIGLVMVPEAGVTVGFVMNNIFTQSNWSKDAKSGMRPISLTYLRLKMPKKIQFMIMKIRREKSTKLTTQIRNIFD